MNTNVQTNSFYENMKDFFSYSAKAWQSYISYEFISGIRLSDSQRIIVSSQNKQLMINGSAGSGKSIVLLYKLIKIMKEEKEPKRFLFLSYNETLIDDMKKRANLYSEFNDLVRHHESVKICTFHEFARDLLKDMGYTNLYNKNITYTNIERIKENSLRRIASILHKYRLNGEKYRLLKNEERLYATHDEQFVLDEILWMKANGFIEYDTYMDCERTGRGNTPRLIKPQRNTIFKIFTDYNNEIENHKYHVQLSDLEDYALILLKKFDEIPKNLKYHAIFADEIQDLDAMQLKLLTQLNPSTLVLAGDPKQRIYKKAPVSLINLGIDVKSNSRNLNENFRSTEEIMKLANSLDFSDIIKDNKKIRYMNNGIKPKIFYFKKLEKQLDYIGGKIKEISLNNPYETIAVITREEKEKASGNSSDIQTYLARYCRFMNIESYGKYFNYEGCNRVIYTDIYNVKGLEFDHVFLLNFDLYHYPSKEEVNDKLIKYAKDKEDIEYIDFILNLASDDPDYIDLINTEKKRLYVAMSRAKKTLEIFCSQSSENYISPFIRDFKNGDYDYYVNLNIKKKKRVG
ncbi:MAG: UvrD-helicase domain-containing protein [Vulcanibacillus sp.]